MFSRTIGTYSTADRAYSPTDLVSKLSGFSFEAQVVLRGQPIKLLRKLSSSTAVENYVEGTLEYDYVREMTTRESPKRTRRLTFVDEMKFWINPALGIVVAANAEGARTLFETISRALTDDARDDVVRKARYDIHQLRQQAQEVTHAGWKDIRGLGNVTSAAVGGPDIDTATDYNRYDRAGHQFRITILLAANNRQVKITVYETGSVIFWSTVSDAEVLALIEQYLQPSLIP